MDIFNTILNTQIDFLLWLQNLRDSHSLGLNQYLLHLTTFGEFFVPTSICAIVYWCIDEIAGTYMFSVCSFNLFFAHIIKMCACIYRPWVLSNKITPLGNAIKMAGGYSFPSGHTLMATSIFGAIANLVRKNWFTLLCLSTVLLVMFSRMWLGVHTPQDVIAGFVIGITIVLATKPLTNWCEQKTDRYLYLLGITNILTILGLIFISYKNYPLNYNNGELIVNPIFSKYTFIIAYAYGMGLFNGTILCRKFFPFKTKDISLLTKIIRGIIGVGLIKYLTLITNLHFFGEYHNFKITFLTMFMIGFCITAIYPLIFTNIEKIFTKNKLNNLE